MIKQLNILTKAHPQIEEDECYVELWEEFEVLKKNF